MNDAFTEKDLICRQFQIDKFNVKKIVPTVSMQIEVQLDALLKSRAEINRNPKIHVTIYQYLLKLIADTLINYPLLYSLMYKGKIIGTNSLIINIPVSVDNHVEYVAIKNPDTKSVEEIACEVQNGIKNIKAGKNMLMQSLIAQHKMNKIGRLIYKMRHYKNPVYFLEKYYGYFPVTNFGTFGISNGISVLSEPIVAGLVVGKAEKKYLLMDGSLCETDVLSLTLSFDHRVMDGAYAAHFLTDLRHSIENVSLSLTKD